MDTINSDPHVLSSRKVWVPLECNPTVMTNLAHTLGLSPKLRFEDVYSLTDEELLSISPRPTHAIIFLFPITSNSEAALAEDEGQSNASSHPIRTSSNGTDTNHPDLIQSENHPQCTDLAQGQDQQQEKGPEKHLEKNPEMKEEKDIIFIPQTIGHACGLMALLHTLLNGYPATQLLPSTPLASLLEEAKPKSYKSRAQLLYDSSILETVYAQAAQGGDSRVPDPNADVPYGFTAFVRGKDGHLWELEGRRGGPVDRGIVHEEEDLLDERVLGLSVYPYINREKIDESRFSCLVLVGGDE